MTLLFLVLGLYYNYEASTIARYSKQEWEKTNHYSPSTVIDGVDKKYVIHVEQEKHYNYFSKFSLN